MDNILKITDENGNINEYETHLTHILKIIL